MYVDVKYSDQADKVRLREHLRAGFEQADEVILMRATNAKLPREEYEAICSEVAAEHPGKVLTMIDEAKLPPWERRIRAATQVADIARWTTGDPPLDFEGQPRAGVDGVMEHAGADVVP